MKKPNFPNEIINFKNHYLLLFREAIIYNLQCNMTPEKIVQFTNDVASGIIYVSPALIAGFRKFTTVEERTNILLEIEKENKG